MPSERWTGAPELTSVLADEPNFGFEVLGIDRDIDDLNRSDVWPLAMPIIAATHRPGGLPSSGVASSIPTKDLAIYSYSTIGVSPRNPRMHFFLRNQAPRLETS